MLGKFPGASPGSDRAAEEEWHKTLIDGDYLRGRANAHTCKFCIASQGSSRAAADRQMKGMRIMLVQ